MKNILSAVLLLCSLTAFAQSSERLIEWQGETEHDFGDLEHKQPVRHAFVFKNTSEQPITVENVRTTCGCTAPDWSYDPVLPGETGTINIEYDAQKTRYFRKRILVFFNEQRKGEKLYITGYVEDDF